MQRWFALFAMVIATLSATVSQGVASTRATRQAGKRQVAACRVYVAHQSDDPEFYSSCFPVMHVHLTWASYDDNDEGLDEGSADGFYRTVLGTHNLEPTVWQEPSKKLHDSVRYQSQVTIPGCGPDGGSTKSTPAFDGPGKGYVEQKVQGDGFYGWNGANPQVKAAWAPTTRLLESSFPCGDGTIPLDYFPGTLSGDTTCPEQPKVRAYAYYAPLKSSGSLARGLTDVWDLTCNYRAGSDANYIKAQGSLVMHERACPRVEKGPGFNQLELKTQHALYAYYAHIEKDGGCYRFVRAYGTHSAAQGAIVDVGFRPVGVFEVAGYATLRRSFVPLFADLAAHSGLCGPHGSNLERVGIKYKTAHQKHPTCHYG